MLFRSSVLALNPRVLVLDEPTAELDPLSSRTVFDLLARYAREHGATVVVVEQKIALLSQYADMLVVVDEGRIRFADAPAQVLEHSDELKAIGVNCPRSTTLMNRLRAEGLYAGAPVRNVREEAPTARKYAVHLPLDHQHHTGCTLCSSGRPENAFLV